jgi:hypothetical protein
MSNVGTLLNQNVLNINTSMHATFKICDIIEKHNILYYSLEIIN